MSEAVLEQTLKLDWTRKQEVSYAVPLWLRDEQIRVNTAAVPLRITPGTPTDEPCAVVCYGPSLNDTWEQIRGFKKIISCSGAHKFLIDRGIVPTWHVDVDPRIHKKQLIGEPHPDVAYLIASTCHPDYVQWLLDSHVGVTLWHVFDSDDEAMRVLPPGEWALTGGCSVGLRALAMARFLGHKQLDVFGMDGCDGPSGKHAAAHPNQAKKRSEVVYEGKTYYTTPGFLEAARTTAHEVDELRDVTVRFHGEGLVQAMMRNYKRTSTPYLEGGNLAFNKPELISSEYRRLNAQLHRDNLAYGVGAGKHADVVKKLIATLKTENGLPPSVLDYGAGKGYLQKALPFPIYQYDPAIPGMEESPRPADLVCCLDVLEHIEPERLIYVLDDLRRCTKQIGYFVVNTKPAQKTLPDGRNTHLIQEGQVWWAAKLGQFFTVAKIFERGAELHALVSPHAKKKRLDTAVAMSVPALEQALAPRLSFSNLSFRSHPYVIGSASDVLPAQVYADMTAQFPPLALFKSFGTANKKFSLSTVNNPNQYAAFLASSDLWRAFHSYVKRELIDQMREVFAEHDVAWPKGSDLKARWEFSLLPTDGGCLRPHTDLPSKLVTIVVSMRPTVDEWGAEWGGGTDVLVPKHGQALDDYKADWAEFDTVHTYPYVPNQAVVFIKGPNSWHGVAPMTGPAGLLRRSLTINIERAK